MSPNGSAPRKMFSLPAAIAATAAGIVAMAGVVINNAIVLVSFINSNRAAGMPIEEACLEAGYTRLRPIWASSITTLVGLLPTAYGWGGFEPFVQPMARAMAWGLAFAMPITLLLIPVGVLLVEDARRSLARMFRRPDSKDPQGDNGQALPPVE